MFNPWIEIIASTYEWFWIAVAVLLGVDWSLGFDKVSATVEYVFDKIGEYLPIESIGPAIILTAIGSFTKLCSIPDSTLFFDLLANLFGVLTIGYIILLVLIAVLTKGLKKLRETCIARREEKARKKTLTPDE